MTLVNRLSAALLLTLTGSLTVSLFFKDRYLWMDEVLSYLLLSDSSLTHVNQAIVSGMDANPPLFVNMYWFLGHWFSLNPFFLKGVSIGLFAITVVWFFRYVTQLLTTEFVDRRGSVATPRQVAVVNFVVITAFVALTYLNYTLATQIRTYSLYLLLGWAYIVVLHQLIGQPAQRRWLVAQAVIGTLFMFTHNVALFYLTATGAFFGLLWLYTGLRKQDWLTYLPVLGVHLFMAVIWLLAWFPSFSIQAQSGVPHSWIPVPTVMSFFETIGDLLPTLSARVENMYPPLVILRVVAASALFIWITSGRLISPERSVLGDPVFSLYLFAGFVVGFTLLLGLTVSLVHTSVFLNRYFWPSTLLLMYQLLYAGWWISAKAKQRTHASIIPRRLPFVSVVKTMALPVFLLLIGVFILVQNRKVPLFSGAIRHDLAQLDPRQPVLFESAYYFLPIRFYQTNRSAYYLLHWPTALDKRNVLESTTDYKILEGVADHYNLTGLIRPNEFTPTRFSKHFYVVDEASRYQIEAFIKSGQVKVHRVIPTSVSGHRILDCSF
ncbi:hypothetical protein [Fibrivirga algicola]|uniref:Glycosyltransferase RgtA/B/C/D-like domain-containing protein n=1 Tax=Fibrivirga algicola TaxID=2950420 RepID=A0ABX0QHV0_9BACT|nr:hypothetical protein [Fibrivirga algicola]NID10517.1 hypothetical protein [Fibrivirga algicola]